MGGDEGGELRGELRGDDNGEVMFVSEGFRIGFRTALPPVDLRTNRLILAMVVVC